LCCWVAERMWGERRAFAVGVVEEVWRKGGAESSEEAEVWVV
jgi:hypothetical protein